MDVTKWLLPDGGLNTDMLDKLEQSLLAATDQIGGLIDQVNQKGFVPVFRCAHSGLLLPGDYVKDWGGLYGVGYGPDPVSEVLDSNYSVLPPMPSAQTRLDSIDQLMHPVGPCMAQVDLIMVSPEEAEAKAAVLSYADRKYNKRRVIMIDRQLKNPRGKVAMYRAAFQKELRT